MRKNVKKQLALRVLSTAALVAMVSSIATAAFADTYDLNKGSVTVETKEDGITYVTQLDNTQKDGYARNDKDDILHDYQDKTGVTITSNGKPTENTITVETAKDQTTDVTLDNVDIEQPDSYWSSVSAPIEIKGNGDTNLELNGNNTVLSGNSDHAGIEKADVNGTGTLTIKDDLNDKGEEKTGTDEDSTLLAGGYYSGAGIGGGSYHDGKNYAHTSNITITGGKITASGGTHGAGIGGGSDGTGKNIRIEGNADVTAFAYDSAGIGSGYQASYDSDITITGNATVTAASEVGSGIGQGLNASGKATITISGNASVNAETFNEHAAIGSGPSSATVNIGDNAAVTAVAPGVAIGTGYGHEGTSTVINITGGTVNAVTRGNKFDLASKPAIGTVKGNLDLTINSSTGKTTVNAYTTSSDPLPLIGTANYYYSSTHKDDSISPSEGAEYNEDGSSHLGEDNAAIINFYRNTTLGTDTYDAPKTLDEYAFHATYEAYGTLYNAKHTLSDKDKGDLTKVVHNRKYMEENPNIDTKKLEDEDLHDWKLVGKVVEPTLEKDGYADYICSIDKCGQTKHVVLPKLTPEPSEPDVPGDNTPDTPNKPDTPKQPDGTTPAPVTPDAPVQDAVPDTAPADTLAADTTADAAVVPADAQNVVQDAKPEAAAAASTAAPAAAALPQTGANWLAVVGTALSGLFLLAAGFVLDRKNRRMN